MELVANWTVGSTKLKPVIKKHAQYAVLKIMV